MHVVPMNDADEALPRLASSPCPHVAETHTGLVFLVGDKAYKVKKPIATDFLDFTTVDRRERACSQEVTLNRRLAPDSYLGVGHFVPPGGGVGEPVIMMRRHPDERRLATMVIHGESVEEHLSAVARVLAEFHASAMRGEDINAEARVDPIIERWQENLGELDRYAQGKVPGVDQGLVAEIEGLATEFIAGRSALFDRRINDSKIVDGHADLLADDIFCLPDGPALLDCLEFDDRLRYVDVIDDAAFLAMDLEFLGRRDLSDYFLRQYRQISDDHAPISLQDFFIAYRAVVRAKVDCVRHAQGDARSAANARRHLEIARDHLHAGAVRLILIGGGPGTGKTTLARSLADRIGARVVSTDDVRAEMVRLGEIAGTPGVFEEGLYTPANVDAVYDSVLRTARLSLCAGRSVILDGTWRDARHRDRAALMAGEVSAQLSEFVCTATLDASVARIQIRTETTSQVTPEIATALADRTHESWQAAHLIDTTRPLAESVAEAQEVCYLATAKRC